MNKRSEPLISVIVPVYQVESYLRPCLESIIKQSYTNWELILIDDGSTDMSGMICDEYAAKERRIKVFHQQNSGLSAARNRGIDESAGGYISFTDSDDVLLYPDYLNELVRVTEETDSQISVCGTITFELTEPAPLPKKLFEETKVVSGRELLLGYDIGSEGYYPFACTARLFKKQCFETLRFPVDITSEDDAISAQLLLDIDRIAYSGLAMYGYRKRSGSIVHTRERSDYYKDQIRIVEWHRKFYLSRKDHELIRISERKAKNSQLLLLLSCDQLEDVKDIPDIDHLDSVRIIRSWPRPYIWDMIHRYDPNYKSVCTEYFFKDELYRVKTIVTLIKSLLRNEIRLSWSLLYPDLHNIISMAEEEKLSMPVSKALRSYDDLPDSYRIKYEIFENQTIRNYFQSSKGNASNGFEVLYPHPWYREIRDESQLYIADLIDAFLLISADMEMTDKDKLDQIVKKKFHDSFDILITLHDKLFVNDSSGVDYSNEEIKLLLGIINGHGITE